MPIYEYECKECKVLKEVLILEVKDEPKCPKCLKLMDKVVSLSHFRLKGGGWGKDGYNSKEST
jgi:putative FmdB family regulatory protein